jgi:hypothetical protein
MTYNSNYGGGYNPPYGGGQNPQPVPGMQGKFTEDFFIYQFTIAALASAATLTASITIQADSDFDWIMSTCSANLTGETTPWSDSIVIPVLVTITDSGSGRQLMSAGIPLTGLAGNGKQPFILPIRRRFKALSSVTAVFTNYGGAEYDNIYLNLIGRKIFKMGA